MIYCDRRICLLQVVEIAAQLRRARDCAGSKNNDLKEKLFMRKLVVCMLAMVLCLITLADCFADENEIGILTQFSVTAEELNEKQVAFPKGTASPGTTLTTFPNMR